MIDLPVEVRELSDTSELPKEHLEYPYVKILDISEALPVVISALPSGTLPVLMTIENTTRKVASISTSANVLYKLVRVSRLEFVRSSDDKTILDTGESILNLGVI